MISFKYEVCEKIFKTENMFNRHMNKKHKK